MKAGLSREIAEAIADQCGKPNRAQERIDEVRQQQGLLRLCGAPTLLGPFVQARLSLIDVKAAVHAHLRRGFLNTKACEQLREDAAAGRLNAPAPTAAQAPPPTLDEIAADVYRRPGATT